jgi:hypothetical protein
MATGLIKPIEYTMPCDRVTVHKVPLITDIAAYVQWYWGLARAEYGPQIGPAVETDNTGTFFCPQQLRVHWRRPERRALAPGALVREPVDVLAAVLRARRGLRVRAAGRGVARLAAGSGLAQLASTVRAHDDP